MNQNGITWQVRGSGELYHSADIGLTLTHYGIKGMKWGVRKEVEKIGKASRTKTTKSLSLPNVNTFKNNPNNKNYKPKTSKEYRQEVAANSRKNTYQTHSGTSLTSTTKTPSSSYSNGYKTHKGTIGFDQLSEEQLQKLVEEGTISKEYAEALLDKKLDQSSASDDNVEAKGSKEYQQELAMNSQKNSFQSDAKKPHSEVKKTEGWKDKVAKGAKAIADTVKKIGKQVANTVSAAAKAAKDWVSKKLNIKKASSTYSAESNTLRGDKAAKLKIPKVSDSIGKRKGVRVKS